MLPALDVFLLVVGLIVDFDGYHLLVHHGLLRILVPISVLLNRVDAFEFVVDFAFVLLVIYYGFGRINFECLDAQQVYRALVLGGCFILIHWVLSGLVVPH